MPLANRAVNPFYVVVVFVGIAFSITACAYGVMTFKAIRGGDEAPSALLSFLDQYGERLLIGEVILLGLATFAAIKTDQVWEVKNEKLKADS